MILDSVLTKLNDAESNKREYVYIVDSVINRSHVKKDSDFKQMSPPIKAYTLRAEDLLLALGLDPKKITPQYPYVRVYLGYSRKPKDGRTPGFRLYLNPVIGADLNRKPHLGGKDVFLDSLGHAIVSGNLGKSQSPTPYVLDLNAPCPNTCAN